MGQLPLLVARSELYEFPMSRPIIEQRTVIGNADTNISTFISSYQLPIYLYVIIFIYQLMGNKKDLPRIWIRNT